MTWRRPHGPWAARRSGRSPVSRCRWPFPVAGWRLAIPGFAAASIFTFVLSWNEVFAASILTVQNRTLPAQMLSTLSNSPLPYRFAGGFVLIVPSLVFIFLIRRYLLSMWGRVVK